MGELEERKCWKNSREAVEVDVFFGAGHKDTCVMPQHPMALGYLPTFFA